MKKIVATVFAVALQSACGSSGPADWSTAKTKSFDGEINGVKFSIELPEGMQGKGDKYAYEFDYRVGDRVYTPDISVSTTKLTTLEESMKQDSREAIFDQESHADGYSYAYENSSYKGREDYIVVAAVIAGDKVLRCHARVTPMTKGGTTKDRIPLIKKFCASIKVKP
jgi:hypothetical protein